MALAVRLCDELRLRRDETLYAAGQLHPALDGEFNRIGEIAMVIKHEAEIDERELSRKRLARDRVVDDRQRERADAASHRIWETRIIDRANSGGQLPTPDRLKQSRVAFAGTALEYLRASSGRRRRSALTDRALLIRPRRRSLQR